MFCISIILGHSEISEQMQKYLSISKTLFIVVLSISFSCTKKEHFKEFILDSGNLTIQLPEDWKLDKPIDLFPDTICKQYIGKNDISGITIEISKRIVYNSKQLAVGLKDELFHTTPDLEITKEHFMKIKEDTTFLIDCTYKLDGKKYFGVVAYSLKIIDSNCIARVFYIHDNQKNYEEIQALSSKILQSISMKY